MSAAKRQAGAEARSYHQLASCVRMGMAMAAPVPVLREGVGGVGLGMDWAAAGRIGRRAAVVRGWIGEASRKQRTGGRGHERASCGWMPSTGRLLEAERWVQRRAFRRERCSERGTKGSAKRSGTKRAKQEDSAPLSISPPLHCIEFMMSSRASSLY